MSKASGGSRAAITVDNPLVGVVIGGVLVIVSNIVVEVLKARGIADLDREKRADDRRLAGDQLQRETLLEIQDVANAVARHAHRMYMRDLTGAADSAGDWGGVALDPELDEADRVARMRLHTLRSRVADERVRELLSELPGASWRLLSATSRTEADAAIGSVDAAGRAIIERTGLLIRESFRVGGMEATDGSNAGEPR